MNRRSFLLGLAAGLAPAVIRIPGLLMPVKAIALIPHGPSEELLAFMRGMEEARKEMERAVGIPREMMRSLLSNRYTYTASALAYGVTAEAHAPIVEG
jgi:hypothetical protein